MKRVLVIDDDPTIVELLRIHYDKDGYSVFGCQNGMDALVCIVQSQPDLILLDLMLPGLDGFSVCRELRKTSEIPIIVLSSRGDVLDKVVCLELGADDFVSKPFDPKELLARIKAVLRRCENNRAYAPKSSDESKPPEIVEYPGLKIDKARYVVTLDGERLEMPPKELELLYFLATHPNRVYTRDQLLINIWGYDFFGESRTIDVHIKRIRTKIEEVAYKNNWLLRTVWGVGYKFEVVNQQ